MAWVMQAARTQRAALFRHSAAATAAAGRNGCARWSPPTRQQPLATQAGGTVLVDGRAEPETVLLNDICFGEGPRWRDGVLFFSDFYANSRVSSHSSPQPSRFCLSPLLRDSRDSRDSPRQVEDGTVVGGGEIRAVDLAGNSWIVAAVPGQPSGLGFATASCQSCCTR